MRAGREKGGVFVFPLSCPKCGLPLVRAENGCQCVQGHRYDFARSGYVNLLLVNGKHSLQPGDDKRMVRARRLFLKKGYYELFREAVCQKALERLPMKDPVVLDAGCGEGYYTGGLAQILAEREKTPVTVGIDISKIAVGQAAKTYKGIQFAVGSVFHLPVLNASCDLAVNLFAPLCTAEILRVLKPGGVFLLGVPDRKHLWQLKQAVYREPYENELKDPGLPGFSLLEDYSVKDWLLLDNNEDIQNLFQMTPYYYKTSRQDQERAERLETLKTQVEFRIFVYRKQADSASEK